MEPGPPLRRVGVPVDQTGDHRHRLDQIIGALAHIRGTVRDDVEMVRADLIADDVNFLLGRIVREAADE